MQNISPAQPDPSLRDRYGCVSAADVIHDADRDTFMTGDGATCPYARPLPADSSPAEGRQVTAYSYSSDGDSSDSEPECGDSVKEHDSTAGTADGTAAHSVGKKIGTGAAAAPGVSDVAAAAARAKQSYKPRCKICDERRAWAKNKLLQAAWLLVYVLFVGALQVTPCARSPPPTVATAKHGQLVCFGAGVSPHSNDILPTQEIQMIR